MGKGKEELCIVTANEGSVSHLMSLSEADRSEWDVHNNPLERELNLTEYENRVRAANGLVDSKSNLDDLSDYCDGKIINLKFRVASGDATDGASELSRRKSEFVQIKTEITDFNI